MCSSSLGPLWRCSEQGEPLRYPPGTVCPPQSFRGLGALSPQRLKEQLHAVSTVHAAASPLHADNATVTTGKR